MHDSLQAGKRVTLDRVGIFADGVAVRRVGEETFRLAREYVDEVDLRQHRRDLRGDPGHLRGHPLDRRAGRRACRSPASSATSRASSAATARFVAINSGANMNFDRLRHVAERADIGGQREALFAVEIPEQQGQLPALLRNARPAQRHRVQLPLRRRRARAALRRPGARRRPQGEGSACIASLREAGYPRHRHDRQRDGEAARALHGRRPRPRHRARAAVPLRVPGAPGRAAEIPATRSARAGTSRCSTTAITARTTAACSRACRCRRRRASISICTCAS